MSNNLYRPYDQRMISGTMAGIARRFGWDTSIVRISFVLISILSAAFPGIIVYLVLWFIIPNQSQQQYLEQQQRIKENQLRTVHPE